MNLANTFRRLLCSVAVALMCMAAAQSASAKYSKASTSFTYGGVSVKVTDRSREVGNPYDTYGYAEYTNNTDHSVVVNWKAYGVLKSGDNLVKVDGGSFKLRAGQSRKEVYSYTSEHYNERDFRKYVVAIDPQNGQETNNASSSFTKDGVDVKVIDRHKQQGRGVNSYGYLQFQNRNKSKVRVAWTVYGVLGNGRRVKVDSGVVMIDGNKTHKEVYQYDNDDDFDDYVADITVTKMDEAPQAADADATYRRLIKRQQQGTLTQQDYTDALEWLENKFDHELLDLFRKLEKLSNANDEAGVDRLVNQNQALLDQYAKIGDIIQDAHEAGKLSPENERRFQRLKDKTEALM